MPRSRSPHPKTKTHLRGTTGPCGAWGRAGSHVPPEAPDGHGRRRLFAATVGIVARHRYRPGRGPRTLEPPPVHAAVTAEARGRQGRRDRQSSPRKVPERAVASRPPGSARARAGTNPRAPSFGRPLLLEHTVRRFWGGKLSWSRNYSNACPGVGTQLASRVRT